MQSAQPSNPSKNNGARVAISWILAVAWAGIIFFMSAHTGSDLSEGDGLVGLIKQWLSSIQEAAFGSNVDIVSPMAHFAEYAVFGGLVLIALIESGVRKKSLLAAIAICSVYAITDEWHQLYVPERACDPMDWAVDTAGATLGALIAQAILKARK